MMLMLDRGKLVGWSRVRMAGRIDGKEWMVMWIWIVDFGTATGTGRKGGSCQSWVCVRVCVCACVLAPTAILQPRVNQTINPSNLSNISNTAKARVGLTDVGDFEKCPLYGAGGREGGLVAVSHALILLYFACIFVSPLQIDGKEEAGDGARVATAIWALRCRVQGYYEQVGTYMTAWYGTVVLSGKAGRKGRRGCDSERASQPARAVRQ